MTRRVDLRSDTVTQPTSAMRDAMANAVVGDDGYGEDPTVNELERRYATMVAKEAALFVPSGVMANQIAVRVLTRPGDVIVAGRGQHVVSFEMGAAARNSSVQFATVDDATGALALGDVMEVIAAELDHQPHVALVAVENTHMPSGGTPWDVDELRTLSQALDGRPLHLDGARLFNAVVATGTSAAQYAAPATTVMTCLSKGLCAPVGSILAGSAELMARARIERKRFGGAMRQAGHIVEQPAQLGAREVRRQWQSGPFAEVLLTELRSQCSHDVIRACVLPVDRVVDRPSGLTIPHDRGLTLVGNPHRDKIGRLESSLG